MKIYFFGWKASSGDYLPCDKMGAIVGVINSNTRQYDWIRPEDHLLLEFSEKDIEAKIRISYSVGPYKIISLEIDDAL